MDAIAGHIEARRVLCDLGIVTHSVNDVVHRRAITVESIDNGLAICDEILDKYRFAIFSKIAGAVFDTSHLSVTISGENAQDLINELRG